ncbi:MAG: ribosome silencing factor [Chloroflexi bacterium]|nr:ribosome silencing factor [Chloroflexota bacterium]
MEPIEIARKAVEAASEKQAADVVLLDVHEVCSFTSYFVLCTGESEPQIKAIYEEIEQTLKKAGVLPRHVEGTIESGWLLLDYGSVVVHIFSSTERQYYDLDGLWCHATPVVRIQ